jgi:Na+/H+ antiporter NhaD/arsenite permease-like protein
VGVTAWLAVAVFAAAYVLIATERVHRVTAALGGAVVMLVIGATDAEHAFSGHHISFWHFARYGLIVTVTVSAAHVWLRYFALV